MASISVHQLLLATKGKKFGELVYYRAETHSLQRLEEAITFAMSSLPHHLKIEFAEILETFEKTLNRSEFFTTDCNVALRYILSETRSHLIHAGQDFSDGILIRILDLIILNIAYSIRQNLKEHVSSHNGSFMTTSGNIGVGEYFARN